jgi:carbon-monoxide dehydrogenase medium subunit
MRNRGTIGGSLAHADPAAELPMLAMLLDAELKIVSARGARVAPAREFFAGALATTLAADELVSEITLAKPPLGSGWGFSEVARRGGDFALAAVAALLTRRGERIAQARIAIMGVGETPLRATAAEALLVGNSVSPDLLEAVGAAVRAACSPAADLHASAEYRRHVVGLLAQQVVGLAWQRATGAAA